MCTSLIKNGETIAYQKRYTIVSPFKLIAEINFVVDAISADSAGYSLFHFH